MFSNIFVVFYLYMNFVWYLLCEDGHKNGRNI